MSPFQIDILVWYYSHADDHPVFHNNPVPISHETLGFFMDNNLIEHAPHEHGLYKITDRGRCFVDHICALELPVWGMV